MTFEEVRRSGERVTCKHEKLEKSTKYDFRVYRYINDYLLHICERFGSDTVNDILDCNLWEIESNK